MGEIFLCTLDKATKTHTDTNGGVMIKWSMFWPTDDRPSVTEGRWGLFLIKCGRRNLSRYIRLEAEISQ